MSCVSVRSRRKFLVAPVAAAVGLLAMSVSAGSAVAGVTASEVVSYSPGSPIQHAWWDSSLTFDHPNAATGLPNPAVGNDPFSGTDTGVLTPFNPPFHPNDIVRVSAGGSLALKLASPVDSGSGAEIGVFANNAFMDVTPGTTYNSDFPYNCTSGGTGTASTYVSDPSEMLLSPSPEALVYVKTNAADAWTQVGSGPISFGNPTNSYTDTLIDKLVAPPGQSPADYFKPFSGTLADFSGKTYPQMLQLLDGSAGGTWIDISSTGLSSVQYIKFEVPTGASYRMMLDAVTAVPEPSAAFLLIGLPLMFARRRGA